MQVYRVSDMELVSVLPSAEDEVNVACFHPLAGVGLFYGTKEGKLRILQHDGGHAPIHDHFFEARAVEGSSIKYLLKYTNKGPDRATVAVVPANNECENNDVVDEIAEYYDCRYLSACEASCRICKYDVQCRYPSVVRLPFHLPNQQQIVYGKDDDIDNVLDKPSVAASKKVGKAIGRIHSVSPNLGEAYFLRILLNKVKGPTSFDDIRTVNGETHSSFRDVCYALGLLYDDKEYVVAIKEANHSDLRSFRKIQGNIWQIEFYITKDKDLKLSLGVDELKNLTFFEIEQILLRNNSTLKNFTKMPYPDVESVSSSNNQLITKELDYDIPVIKINFDRMFLALKNEQRNIFLKIMSVVKENKGDVFFVYGYGGTDKTFLWKTISAAIRSDGNIVLNVASSGIASLLLPGGKTAHSRFILPFELS
ncbi:uncharacterized protein LOC128133368 [Lactuca sativa]|uniref:uncharacterized protein LOC128133368 n=1 Tax=Lactuca sativa TaxID=4236 RepID=UPI0022AF77C3|nr:uncharacterized protein LOC128133368 [Lactuca sativa]